MRTDGEMTVREALSILGAEGFFTDFDLQFSEALARSVSSGKSDDDIDLLRITAALAAKSCFTAQSPCLDIRTQGKSIFPAGPEENEEQEESGEIFRTASRVLSAAAGKDLKRLFDRTAKSFPEIVFKTTDIRDEAPFVPLIWNPPRLYLQRFWSYEKELAEMLVRKACEADTAEIPESDIRGLCSHFTNPEDDGQWKAVQLALRKKFCIITGGPGTGKTTIVSAILARMIIENPNSRILLCAPTGKAQARMLESIGKEIRGPLLCDAEVKARIAEIPASTIHRLLKYNPRGGGARLGMRQKLKGDLLVVDEVSMVSLPLMVRLMRALPEKTAVLLLGDADQLASVETGAVMADICELAAEPRSKWKENIARLTVSYRFRKGGEIDTLKESINRGDADTVLNFLSKKDWKSIEWGITDETRLPGRNGISDAIRDMKNPWDKGYMSAQTPEEAISNLGDFQILCSHRGGPFGTKSLNRLIRRKLNIKRTYERGVPLIVTRNSYAHGLFNGDIGVCWPGKDGAIKVFFPDPDKPGRLRAFSPSALPEHEDSFAMTVHKSQGSGFEEVLLVLPDSEESPILTRELLYTGVTRAVSKVRIWATERTLRAAISRKTVRPSGLKERLEKALPASGSPGKKPAI